MQIKRFIATLSLFMAMGIAATASGQIIGRPGQAAGGPLGASPFTSDPDTAVFDPGLLDYDMQPFAPLDIAEFDGEPDYSGGFFVTYDRTFLSVRRPRPFGPLSTRSLFPRGSDFQSGNKFTLGNMGPDGAGWDLGYIRSSGLTFNPSSNPATPMMVVTSMHFFQINRAFRQSLSRGGFIEPYFGMRYTYFQDTTREDDAAQITNPPGVVAPVAGTNTFTQTARNSIIGGAAGIRLYKSLGRWSWTADTSLSGGFNTQTYLINDALSINGANVGNFPLNRSGNSFTPMVDFNTEVTFALTRDVAIRAGSQVNFMWSGVTRANTVIANNNPNSLSSNPIGVITNPTPFGRAPAPVTNQAALVAGFTLGVEWRR